MIVDTHCHLDAMEFDADRAMVAKAAVAAGVGMIVVPSVASENFATVSHLCTAMPGCAPAYGIHPLYADRAQPRDIETLRGHLQTGVAVAVGEIGLDYYVEGYDAACQEWYFVEQLKLAREFELPVLLHIRRAADQVLKQLRRTKVVGGIAHAFNGSRQQAEAFIELGFKLGFGGAMTWPRAIRIRELATTLPIEAVVLETDAPDIPPVWLGSGGRNAPDQLPKIAEELAALRGVALSEVIEKTTLNALQVMPKLAGYAHHLK